MTLPMDPILTDMPVKVTNWPKSKEGMIRTTPKTTTLKVGDTDAQLLLPHTPKRRHAVLTFSGPIGTPTQGQQAAGFENFGTATGPGALGLIASVSLPPGVYTVYWQVGLGAGAVAAAEANNFRLRQAGATLLNSINAAVANTQVPQEQITIVVPAGGSQTIDIVNIGAGTATANYEAQISAIPVTPVIQSLPSTSYGWIGVSKSDAQKQTGAFVDAGTLPIELIGCSELWGMIDPGATTNLLIAVYSEVESES